MATTHLSFFQPCTCGSCDVPHQLDIVLQGEFGLSPYVEVNRAAFILYASYTHADGTVENLYQPLFTYHADSH